jgi:hypothetical protein
VLLRRGGADEDKSYGHAPYSSEVRETCRDL